MVTESQARMDEYIEGRRLSQAAIIKEINDEKDKEIERLRKELISNIEQITDIFECADKITTGNVSHNIKWLKLITNEMVVRNRQALKER